MTRQLAKARLEKAAKEPKAVKQHSLEGHADKHRTVTTFKYVEGGPDYKAPEVV